ncbi:MAG: sialate O-acetylesterase, partial [Candidatus Omnitrophica bacterium]|nr:sialate O-acetylesterase [Candidatus Omnitrophota bacterium]
MRQSRRVAFLILAFTAILAMPAMAEVSLPSIIGSNMVLQRSSEVPIWGWANPGEEVKVEFLGQSPTAKADDNGRWMVHIDTSKTEDFGPHTMTVSSSNSIELGNILLGEVWLCSGQSNMEWPVNRVDNAEGEILAADYPSIRLFSADHVIASAPQSDVTGEWVECSSKTIEAFSAVGYFFGRALHANLKVPIGLVKSAWGGTPSEAWTSQEMVKAEPDFDPIVERWQGEFDKYPETLNEFRQELADYETEAAAREA